MEQYHEIQIYSIYCLLKLILISDHKIIGRLIIHRQGE